MRGVGVFAVELLQVSQPKKLLKYKAKLKNIFMNILTKLIVNVNELKRGTKVPAKFIIIYSSEHVMISSLLLHNSRSDH